MNSNEINQFAKTIGIDSFLGVYAADQLCSIEKHQRGVLICNTDPSNEIGQHWIGICLKKSLVIYFDSLNGDFHKSNYIKEFLKKVKKNFLRNDLQIQNFDSDKCGYHALVFCFILSKKSSKITFFRFLSSFSPHKLAVREQISMNYFYLIT